MTIGKQNSLFTDLNPLLFSIELKKAYLHHFACLQTWAIRDDLELAKLAHEDTSQHHQLR